MTQIDEMQFVGAQRAFAVANTPLFLLRKLKDDADVQQVSREFNGAQLISLLESSLRYRPKTIRDAVLPFIFLVALSFKEDKKFLDATITIARGYPDEWFDYLRSVLIQTYRSTQFSTLVPNQPRPKGPSSKDSSATSSMTFKL